VLVNLEANSFPDFHIYEYPVLSERVAQIYQT
jgi:hypothetical protein